MADLRKQLNMLIENGYTVDELARLLDVSRSTINRWKNGITEPQQNICKILIKKCFI